MISQDLADKAWEIIQEVEGLGGMTKAIETGMPKLRIEECAAAKQARIDRGEDTIVGVNKYRLAKEDPVEILEVDNTTVREKQLERLATLRQRRDAAAVREALSALTEAARSGAGNLLELAVIATRARATVGEISDALEAVYGRHRAQAQSVSGVYGAAYEQDADWQALRQDIADFERDYGRRPRIMVAKLGQDGHDRGAKVIATAFADLGFDVDIGPLFQTPQEAARQAVENDVHVVGVSSLAAGHKTLVPQIIEALRAEGAEDILVVVGGVIPAQDYDFLREAGVAGIFGPGTVIPRAARDILAAIRAARPAPAAA
jgi:methylmalonyl-CoA mutase